MLLLIIKIQLEQEMRCVRVAVLMRVRQLHPVRLCLHIIVLILELMMLLLLELVLHVSLYHSVSLCFLSTATSLLLFFF